MYSPGWQSSGAELTAIAQTIMGRKDVDLILSMGTDATKALLAVNNGTTPIIGIAITDPLHSGIIASAKTTGIPNLALRYIPNRGLQMFRIFHQIGNFSKIGIIYENTDKGRSFAYLQDAVEAGRDRGFQIIKYPHWDSAHSAASCAKGVNELISKGIDAMYLSEITCFDPQQYDIAPLLHKLHDNHILTFSSTGEEHVSRGVFMGVSTTSDKTLGGFYATMIIDILDRGKKPEEITISAQFTPEIILNIREADDLGINFQLSVLMSADKIFDTPIYTPLPTDQKKP
ncbi:MAG: ABC transporter substrate binding protein [Desulfobulbus sp.]|nr:ABC transporter substrate binding protein [Desulfobulbus sp.]